MKKYSEKFKEGIILGIGFLCTIVVGVFAYNSNYTTIPYVSSGSILTADTFNQLLVNIDSLKNEINTLSGTLSTNLQTQDNINNYSMEELWTGKYWVDGRKIYRKVINIGLVPEPSSLGTKTQYETYYNIQNVDYFTSITGMANRPKDKNMWNFFIPSSDDVGYGTVLTANNEKVILFYRSSLKNYQIFAILEYVCTDR